MSEKNSWPRAIITVLSVFLAGLIVYVVFTTRHKMDMVSEDYYERELIYQDHLDNEERALNADSGITVKYDPEKSLLRFMADGTPPESTIPITAHLYRPSDAEMDRSIEFTVNAKEAYELPVKDLPSGFWRVKLTWVLDGEGYFRETSVVLE